MAGLELLRALVRLLRVQAARLGAGAGLIAQTPQGDALKHDKAPRLQFAVVGAARGSRQDRRQLFGRGDRQTEGFGRTRTTCQQEIKCGGVGIGHKVSFGLWSIVRWVHRADWLA